MCLVVGPCSQYRGWFSESPPRRQPCICSRAVPMLFKGKKPSSVFKGVNPGLGTISNNIARHFAPVIGHFWKSDGSWKMLGPLAHSQITMSSWACVWLAAGISAWPVPHQVFKDEGEHRPKGKVVCPFRQADTLCGSRTVSNVRHCLEGSPLSISVWGQLLQLSQCGKLGTRASTLTPRPALCP